MSDPIVNIVRREIERSKNPGGMVAGMPKVTISASHAERLCILADLLEQERARVAELESNGRQLVELFDDKLTDNLIFSEYALLRVIVDEFRDRTTDAWLLRKQAEAVEEFGEFCTKAFPDFLKDGVRIEAEKYAQRLRNQADEAEKGGSDE